MKNFAFTLAELLIALAILGVIATFTIPKVLTANQAASYNAIAKETLGMVSGAYLAYQTEHTADTNTTFADITPYINYVKILSSPQVYDAQNTTGSTVACTTRCLLLHNGAILIYWDVNNFSGTSQTNAIIVNLDPSAERSSSSTTGPEKSLGIILYFNGAIATSGTAKSNTTTNNRFNNNPAGIYTFGANASLDPQWLSWN